MINASPNQGDLSLLVPRSCNLSREVALDLERSHFGERKTLLIEAGIKLAAGIVLFVLAFYFCGPQYKVNKGQALIALIADMFKLDLSGVHRVVGFMTPVMFGLFFIAGVIYLVMALPIMPRLIIGRIARKDPVATTKFFFASLINNGVFGPGVEQAWYCLLESAKADFNRSLVEFQRKWQEHMKRQLSDAETQIKASGKASLDDIRFEVKSVKQLRRSGDLALVLAHLSAKGISWQEIRLLAQVSTRWYLVDGSPYDAIPAQFLPFHPG